MSRVEAAYLVDNHFGGFKEFDEEKFVSGYRLKSGWTGRKALTRSRKLGEGEDANLMKKRKVGGAVSLAGQLELVLFRVRFEEIFGFGIET